MGRQDATADALSKLPGVVAGGIGAVGTGFESVEDGQTAFALPIRLAVRLPATGGAPDALCFLPFALLRIGEVRDRFILLKGGIL